MDLYRIWYTGSTSGKMGEKSSHVHEILYTTADFELDGRHFIKNEKVALDRLRVRQNVFLVISYVGYRFVTACS